jgi:hypothetical protein
MDAVKDAESSSNAIENSKAVVEGRDHQANERVLFVSNIPFEATAFDLKTKLESQGIV